MPCLARQYVNAGTTGRTPEGKPYFIPSEGDFGPIHYGSYSENQANYLLFDDDSLVNMVDDCVISVYNNKTKLFE